jgi:hypothetical protein
VIEIMGEKDPYPTLLGIDWAYENYVVIDLKKETMTFESDGHEGYSTTRSLSRSKIH